MMLAGCLVSDQLVTLTIQPDGSADWVSFQSNIRSTEKGLKGSQELREFVEKFDLHQDADYVRVSDAGGEVLEARWIRNEEPYSNLLVARFPNAASLEKFCTIKGEKGEIVAPATFSQNENRRRLGILIPVPREEKPAKKEALSFREMRERQANSLSETRMAVVGGRIIASQGFLVAGDKRSALLELSELEHLLQTDQEQVEVFIEWELVSESP
jgi:hypothetical protein